MRYSEKQKYPTNIFFFNQLKRLMNDTIAKEFDDFLDNMSLINIPLPQTVTAPLYPGSQRLASQTFPDSVIHLVPSNYQASENENSVPSLSGQPVSVPLASSTDNTSSTSVSSPPWPSGLPAFTGISTDSSSSFHSFGQPDISKPLSVSPLSSLQQVLDPSLDHSQKSAILPSQLFDTFLAVLQQYRPTTDTDVTSTESPSSPSSTPHPQLPVFQTDRGISSQKVSEMLKTMLTTMCEREQFLSHDLSLHSQPESSVQTTLASPESFPFSTSHIPVTHFNYLNKPVPLPAQDQTEDSTTEDSSLNDLIEGKQNKNYLSPSLYPAGMKSHTPSTLRKSPTRKPPPSSPSLSTPLACSGLSPAKRPKHSLMSPKKMSDLPPKCYACNHTANRRPGKRPRKDVETSNLKHVLTQLQAETERLREENARLTQAIQSIKLKGSKR